MEYFCIRYEEQLAQLQKMENKAEEKQHESKTANES
jgi:hypothetical protein